MSRTLADELRLGIGVAIMAAVVLGTARGEDAIKTEVVKYVKPVGSEFVSESEFHLRSGGGGRMVTSVTRRGERDRQRAAGWFLARDQAVARRRRQMHALRPGRTFSPMRDRADRA